LPYILRRIQRIYPTFLVVFLVYIVLSFIFPNESKLPLELNDKVVFILQNLLFLPGLFDIKPIMTVAWTLSYEFFYYLAIPILITLLSLRSYSRRVRIILFLGLSIVMFTYFFINTGSYGHGGKVRLMMFVSGIILYELIKQKDFLKINGLGLIALMLSFIVIVLINIYSLNTWYRYLSLFIFFFILCLDTFREGSLTNKIFIFKPLRYLGNMSFSYYLLHSLVLKALFMILVKLYPSSGNITMIAWVIMLVFFLITLIPSTILFMLVEKPFSLTKKT